MINKVSDDAVFRGYLWIQYTMIAMPLSMVATTMLFRKLSMGSLLLEFKRSGVQNVFSRDDSFLRIGLYSLTVVCVVGVIYTYAELPQIPHIEFLRGASPFQLAKIRILADTDFGGIVYVKNLVALLLTPFLCYVAYAYWFKTKNVQDAAWFFLLLVVSFFALTYNFAKGPLVSFVVGLAIVRICLVGHIRWRTLIGFAILALLVLVASYAAIMGSINLASLIRYNTGPVGRVILSQSSSMFMVFDVFPHVHDFIGWRSVSNILSSILSGEPVPRMGRIIMEYANPGGVEAGTAGVSNTLFEAEAFANFGYAGLLLAPFVVGFVIQSLYVVLIKQRKTPITVALLGFLAIQLPVTGGFNDFIYNPSLAFLLAALVCIWLVGRGFRKIERGY